MRTGRNCPEARGGFRPFTRSSPLGRKGEHSLPSPAELWTSLSAELNSWFHDPDLEAFRVGLAAVCTHYYPQEKPVWLMVIGDSGSGKTEILIHSINTLPLTRMVGAFTPSCFLSSWQHGGKSNSLLHRSGASCVWLAKDFTTFSAMRADARAEVAASLREIWDGSFIRDTGVGKTNSWEGKITLIAVATPEVEEHWGALRGLGDRFLTLRWRSPGFRGMADKVRAQLGKEREIRARVRPLVSALADPAGFPPVESPSPAQMSALDSLALIVATLRVHVVRENDNSRAILRVPRPELPTRIVLAMGQVARTHAAIFGRAGILDEDLAIARRLALDSIPDVRRRILAHIPPIGWISCADLLEATRVPRTTLTREVENLCALDVLAEDAGFAVDWSAKRTGFSPDFRRDLAASGIKFGVRGVEPVIISPPRAGGER